MTLICCCRFGVVFKVKDKKDKSGEVFAAKFVRCRKSEEKQKVKDEICIMNSLDHSKLLQLAAAYENPREIIMVMVRVRSKHIACTEESHKLERTLGLCT